MSNNYPEHHGKYERTELVTAKFQKTMAEKRRDRFRTKAEDAQREVRDLEQKIEDLQKAETTMDPFEELKTTDRYKELEALPLATDMEARSMSGAGLSAVAMDSNGKDYNLMCYVFEDGTRTKFREYVLDCSVTK